MLTSRSLAVVFVSLSSFVVACDDGETPPQRGDQADAREPPRDALVSELAAADGKRLCVATLNELERIEAAAVRVSCTFDAIGTAACGESVDACVKADADSENSPDCDAAVDEVTGGKDCHVRVADFRSCLRAMAESSESYARTVDCDTDLTSLPGPGPAPKLCTDIAPDCARLVMLRN